MNRPCSGRAEPHQLVAVAGEGHHHDVFDPSLVNGCCTVRELCDRCRADTFAQLRGTAATRGEVWAMGLVGRIPRDWTWPDHSDKVMAVARLKVADLTKDVGLLELLADELARWAQRWWSAPLAVPLKYSSGQRRTT
jgi:hypothetical protein